jgi:hypothetical protein
VKQAGTLFNEVGTLFNVVEGGLNFQAWRERNLDFREDHHDPFIVEDIRVWSDPSIVESMLP